MKSIHMLIAAVALVCTAAACSEVEQTRDAGFGFRLVTKAEPTGPGGFEAVAHYTYFFYKGWELGKYDSYSVSPSGRYAVFQDAPTGDSVLFTPATAQRRVVAKFSGSLAQQYVWLEKQAELIIEFENRTSVRIQLRTP